MYLISTAIIVYNKGNFEKVPGHNFFKFSLNIHTSVWFMYLKFYANHLFVVYTMRIINQQCRITFVYIHKKQWYAKQKHPECKKCARPRRSSIVNGYIYATKSFDINQGQEIIYQNPLSCLNDNSLQCILTAMIGCHLATFFVPTLL